MKLRWALMCILLLASSSSFSREIEVVLSRAGLVESKIPTGDAWFAANRDLVDYAIASDAGQLTIKEGRNLLKREDKKITFHDKLLVGTNQGEWGGNLSIIGSDGSKHIVIADNIAQLIKEEDELFVFTGFAHLGSAQGAIYKIIRDNEDIKVEKVTLLPGAPEAVAIERNERGYFAFLVVTNNGLLSYSPRFGGLKILAIDQFWNGLYPTSAQLHDGQLVIGMRSGVTVVSMQQSIGIGSVPRVTKIRYFSRAKQ